MPTHPVNSKSFAVCVENKGFDASIETRKIYLVLPDESADAAGMIRVIDESAEDYLYPANWFVPIQLSGELEAALNLSR